MKYSKIVIVLLGLCFCVGALAPPASALMRDPTQPRVDEKPWANPGGDEGGWGGNQLAYEFPFEDFYDMFMLSIAFKVPVFIPVNYELDKPKSVTANRYERNTGTSPSTPVE